MLLRGEQQPQGPRGWEVSDGETGGPRTLGGVQAKRVLGHHHSCDVWHVGSTPSLGGRSASVFGTCPAVPAPSQHLSLAGHAVE